MTDAYLLKSDGKKFLFKGVGGWSDRKSQSVEDFDMPEATESERLLFRFSGARREIRFSFKITDSATDVADGTYTSTVKTISEQIDYLMNVFYSSGASDYWTVYQDRYYPSGEKVAVEDITLSEESGDPSVVTGMISLVVGSVES